jgi:dihydrolipoamide dehydrogenase
MDFDLIVIGAGPGGYVAAIRAAQLGLSVCIVEKDKPGGVCLNWGCIPSKNLIHQAEQFSHLNAFKDCGVNINIANFDYTKVQEKSRGVVKTLTDGITHLLKKNGVKTLVGTAKISGSNQITVYNEASESTQQITAKNILLATGSRPMTVPGFEFDEQQVLSSSGILACKTLPKNLIVLGAGAIGCEFTYVMNSFGVEVTLVELADQILPSEDKDNCDILAASFAQQGIKILTSTKALSLDKHADHVNVEVEHNGQKQTITADKVLVVFGRKPNTENLGLQEIGLQLDNRGFVEVTDYQQTSRPNIFAIGDITATPALAHVASKEGEIAVEHIAGLTPIIKQVDPLAVPSAIYCEPQVAGFGVKSRDKNPADIKVSTFAFHGAGKTVAIGKTTGQVKIVVDKHTDEILGAHIVGYNATELIHQLLQAKHAELLPEDIATMIHAHPTISETILEAAKGINGLPIHS